jgi:hypothetical protein
MIKVPGTDVGIAPIGELLAEGLNLNITLLFARERHEQVMWTYVEALERRAAASLLAAVTATSEGQLWTALRSLEENVLLLTQLGDHFAAANEPTLAASYYQHATTARARPSWSGRPSATMSVSPPSGSSARPLRSTTLMGPTVLSRTKRIPL